MKVQQVDDLLEIVPEAVEYCLQQWVKVLKPAGEY